MNVMLLREEAIALSEQISAFQNRTDMLESLQRATAETGNI